MDQCLVISKDMRENALWTIHFGHAVSVVMLRGASDVWWPLILRETLEKAKSCAD